MNNTTERTVSIVAILMAATLVVGAFATTPAAFAAKNNNSGNTVTIQKCKQAATESGFDNTLEQECQNLICTHPGNNATCSQEGVVTPTSTPQPTNKTCEQCFTTFLTPDQISKVLGSFKGVTSLADLCALLERGEIEESGFRVTLFAAGVDVTTQNELIACLIKAGIVFLPPG